MRLSQLFSQTRREVPAAADSAAQQLLLRAGYLFQTAPGSYVQLPLARRSINRLQQRMTSDLQDIGAQEIRLPLQPPGASMAAAAVQLSREHIRSYKQLPALLYSIHPEWQSAPANRGMGLLRLRQQNCLRLFGFFADPDSAAQHFEAVSNCFQGCFERCNLPAVNAESSFNPESQPAHIYFLTTAEGDSIVFSCDRCGYRAEQAAARAHKTAPPAAIPLEIEAVATPQAATIEALAQYLGIPTTSTAKAVFYMMIPEALTAPSGHPLQEEFVFAIVRGDTDVNESKLAHALKAAALRPASEGEICAVGAAPGYASPVGLSGVRVVVDTLIPESPNLVAGANRHGYHLRNVNYGRDYRAQLVADITTVREGDPCPKCRSRLAAQRGVILARFAMPAETSLSEGLCTFLDETGKTRPLLLASHWLGMENLLAGIAETNRDPNGMCLPPCAAPFNVHMVVLAGKSGQPQQTAERLAAEIEAAGVAILIDDRVESPGVKFNDADLIGIPLRVTVSERSLNQGGVEIMPRRGIQPRRGEICITPLEDALKTILKMIVES